MPKLCIAGKNDIAINVLQHALSLLPAGEIVACVNGSDDGIDGWQRSFRRFAEASGIRMLELQQVEQLPGIVFLSVEFDRLVRPERFTNARLYNLHFSLLPRYKGMYTSAWPIIQGERQSGVTLHEIDAGIDTGPIIAQEAFELPPHMTCEALYMRYLRQGAELVRAQLPVLLKGAPPSAQQSAEDASYFSRGSIRYSELELDLNKTAIEIKRQIQAYAHRRYQLPHVHGQAVVGAQILLTSSYQRPGTLLAEDEFSLTIATVDYSLKLWRDRQHDLFEAARAGCLETVRGLLRNQCYVDERNEQGLTLLMVALQLEHPELVRMLLAEGAELQAVDFRGRPAWAYGERFLRLHGIALDER